MSVATVEVSPALIEIVITVVPDVFTPAANVVAIFEYTCEDNAELILLNALSLFVCDEYVSVPVIMYGI